MYLLACFENFLTSAVVNISRDKLSLTQSLPLLTLDDTSECGQLLPPSDAPWFAESSFPLRNLYKWTLDESG